MTVILGIDPSLTATGCALHDTEDRLVIETWTVTSGLPRRPGIPARIDRFRGIGADVFECGTIPDLVVIEAPAYSSRTGQQHDRSGLWWHLVLLAVALGAEVVEVTPQTVKKYATGKGNADKDTVLLAVERRYPHARVGNNNEADAVILAALGARGIGLPLEDAYPGKDRLEACNRIEWPARLVVDPPRRVCQCTSDDECTHDPEGGPA